MPLYCGSYNVMWPLCYDCGTVCNASVIKVKRTRKSKHIIA